MTPRDQITPAPSADGALSALAANYTDVVANRRSVPQPDVIDLTAAELAVHTGGEGTPADAAAGCAAKASRSAADQALIFQVAAVLRGHDLSTEAGRHAARHDFRMWDLIEEMTP